MANFTNKKIQYSVTNESTELKLTGNISVSNSKINSFDGSFSTTSGEFVGNFYYNEGTDDKVNKSFSEIGSEYVASATALLDATINDANEIK
jgi:hypothetical protein